MNDNIVTLGSLKEGDWFFYIDNGELMTLKKIEKAAEVVSYVCSDGVIEVWLNADTEVAALNLKNKNVAVNVKRYEEIMLKDGILTPKTSKHLKECAHKLFEADEFDAVLFGETYKEIDQYIKELNYHMSFLK